jgi:hypothetical protein
MPIPDPLPSDTVALLKSDSTARAGGGADRRRLVPDLVSWAMRRLAHPRRAIEAD